MEGCKEDTISVRRGTVEALAKALNVDPKMLTGERDLPFDPSSGDHRDGSREVRQTTIRLDPQSTLNYDLIERRYGMNLQEVVNIAPLLFVIHAEQSLRRRKRVSKEKLRSMEQVMQMSDVFPKLKELIGYPEVDEWYEESDDYLSERDSIQSNDVFGQRVWNEFPGDGSPNPFVAHLDAVLEDLDSPLLANISRFEGIPFDAVMYFPGNRVPEHEVCRSDLMEITGSDPDAIMALKFGIARIRDIPEAHMGPDKLVERVTWLRERLQERTASTNHSSGEAGAVDDTEAERGQDND